MSRDGKRAVEKELEITRPITEEIIAAAMEVHKEAGAGLPSEAYRDALAYELEFREVRVEVQKPFLFPYRERKLDLGLRADLFVEDSVVVQVEAVDALTDELEAELRTCLRAAGHRVGLLFNFNVLHLTDGLRRITDES